MPPVQWVKAHAQWCFGGEALKGTCALNHCTGGHLSVLGQSDKVCMDWYIVLAEWVSGEFVN